MKVFCPNCEKEQEAELYSEVYECTVCREWFETKENPTNKRLAEVEAERDEWRIRSKAMEIDIETLARMVMDTTAELALWKADAERLSGNFVDGSEVGVFCRYCGTELFTVDQCLNHVPDCPITLHRELEEKYGGEG